jgi:gamma-butyrobetaine dioxygenase
MLIMDNYRLFHGRSAFQLEGGIRHMRQGYMDRDSTASRRLLLADQLADQLSGQPDNREEATA